MVSSVAKHSTEFSENWRSSFCIILLTNIRQTNAHENITFVAEVMSFSYNKHKPKYTNLSNEFNFDTLMIKPCARSTESDIHLFTLKKQRQ